MFHVFKLSQFVSVYGGWGWGGGDVHVSLLGRIRLSALQEQNKLMSKTQIDIKFSVHTDTPDP